MICDTYMPDHNPETAKTSKLRDLLLVSVISNLMGTSLLISLVFTIFPQVPVCFGNIIPTEHFTLSVRIVHTVYYTHMVTVIYANLSANAAIIIIYMTQMIPFVVNEFRLDGVKRYRTVAKFRTAHNLMVEYRSVQILHLAFMEIFGHILVPLHFVFMKLVFYCNFVVIRHRDEIHPAVVAMMLLWSIFGSLFWSIFLSLGGHVYAHSTVTRRSWKNWRWESRLDGVIIAKFRKSCKIFMVNYGNTYVIKRRSILQFMKGLTRGTFRVLLTIKK
ncbi:unnamed protein product [Orchesella dallaii]|uniref:G protein-coupled receptor n=1 Tax=Orchesella dallaii TaxID=48710 RepID=A0ABP1RP80_9HEXA